MPDWVDLLLAILILAAFTAALAYLILDAVEPFIRADERERIAQAIEAMEIRQPWGPSGSDMVDRNKAARIARSGGRDEG